MKKDAEANKDFRKKASDYFDFKLLAIVGALTIIGLMSIFSATHNSASEIFFYKQLIAVGIGIVGMVAFSFVPEKILKSYSPAFYLVTILLLVAVLFVGKTVSGTKGWFQIANLSFQPAEIAKIGVLLLAGRFLSRKGVEIESVRDVFITAVIFLIPTALIILQPDMGTASAFIILFLAALFWTGFDLFFLYFVAAIPFVLVISLLGVGYFIAAVVAFSIGALLFKKKLLDTVAVISFIFVVGYFSKDILQVAPQNTQNRIETFMYPREDPLNKGYNVMQSVLAVGSGGFFGKGYLQGSQTQLRYIPEQRTDFIFCVPAEEFGFIGSAAVVLLYVGLLIRALKIASSTDSEYLSLVSFGIAALFFYHAFVNVGMAIRLLPVMGIPLPFMSYGGSAVIVNLSLIGILIRTYRRKRIKPKLV